ncbi:PAR1 protein [Cinnamomum micranthum f. kanehirae]|uniref:PAR1 protein n=1 Tax=Cinnamomum micranthum f. kanehirae TaxID=337451 RepID=A0A3S3MXY6_9MAGN|nr:PAR1 protein [Cinnamomum micranthum f. kanehirae]
MASFTFSKLPLALFLSLSFFLHGALGNVICENLPKDVCAFSISSTGKRCLIETSSREGGTIEYQCRASEVMVERMKDWIETDDCVRACGVDRNSVGISSDSLMESQFTTKLCSPACYQDCPNIIDLYFNLAAGEGVFLPDLCEVQRTNPHRAMVELLSSGAAPGPFPAEASSAFLAPAPM